MPSLISHATPAESVVAKGHIPTGIAPVPRLMVAERGDGLLRFQLGVGPCPVTDLRQCAGKLPCILSMNQPHPFGPERRNPQTGRHHGQSRGAT